MKRPLAFPSPALADEVVALRPWSRDDVHDLTRLCRDPEIPRYTRVPADYTPEIGAFFVDGSPLRARSGEALELAVVSASDGGLLGAVGLQEPDWDAGSAEIGYWVGRDARRRGVATRTVRLLSGWSLGELDLRRLEIATLVDNVASQRVALAAGYTRVGIAEKHHEHHGVMRDCVVFELRRRADSASML